MLGFKGYTLLGFVSSLVFLQVFHFYIFDVNANNLSPIKYENKLIPRKIFTRASFQELKQKNVLIEKKRRPIEGRQNTTRRLASLGLHKSAPIFNWGGEKSWTQKVKLTYTRIRCPLNRLDQSGIVIIDKNIRGGGVSSNFEDKYTPEDEDFGEENRNNSEENFASKLDNKANSGNKKVPTKFVIITGGVISGIGKGVTASSIGLILKMMGYRPTAIKIDPYLNVDAGTMSPFEHGECFVLNDGGETDLDLGNYERFLDVELTSDSNLTTGKVYLSTIEKERRGDFLGKTVQVVPHITDTIQEKILKVSRQPVDGSNEPPDICVIELGGTLGDIESMPFVEALRQLQTRVGYKNCCFVHVSMVPVVGSPGEQKTKPTQHSVKEMRSLGLFPDLIVCRGSQSLSAETRDKLSMFCQVPEENVISVHDVSNIFRVPLLLMEQRIPELLTSRLRLNSLTPKQNARLFQNPEYRVPIPNQKLLEQWHEIADRADDKYMKDAEGNEKNKHVKIAIVGKYTGLHDSYLSVSKAITHAALATCQNLKIVWINAEDLEDENHFPNSDINRNNKNKSKRDEAWEKLRQCDGIVVPGGFGTRGLEGKLKTVNYARTKKVPFLGICLGMQAAVIEYARNVLGITRATSTECLADLSYDLIPDKEDFIIFMPEGDKTKMGGTMRLGARTTLLKNGSKAQNLYNGALEISERHRHRYEVNPKLVNNLEAAGLIFSGRDTTGERMEVIELGEEEHPYFLAAQYHPEYTSRPTRPSPLFLGLLESIKQSRAMSSSRINTEVSRKETVYH